MREMTGQEAMLALTRAKMFLSSRYPNVKLDEKHSIGYGQAVSSNGGLEFTVGVREFRKHWDESLPVNDMVTAMVAMCHEVLGHGDQKLRLYEGHTDLAKVLALNEFACLGSDYYYGIEHVEHDGGRYARASSRYFSQPYEIAAQYAGIKGTYGLLSVLYSEREAESMIMDYVNRRIADGSEFINSAGRSVRDVLRNFDVKFRKSIRSHRDYGDGIHVSGFLPSSPWKDMGPRIAKCRDGLKQDWMMATVNQYAIFGPSGEMDYPVFDDLDMGSGTSPKTFLKPKVKTRNLTLHELDPELDMLLDNVKSEDTEYGKG